MADAYTCPMHPEVERTAPGKCPKCGMDLEPKRSSEEESQGGTRPEQIASGQQAPRALLELRIDPAAFTYKGRPLTEWLDRLERVLEKVEGAEGQAQSGGGDMGRAGQKYSCPMHPEVVSDRPGKCPKCGMDLEPQAEKQREPEPHQQHSPGGGQHQMMIAMAMSTAQTRWALPISVVLAAVVSLVVARPVWPLAAARPSKDAVVEVGTLLLSRYMIAFEGAAMLILAGIVTAVMMGRRERSDLVKAEPAPPVVPEPPAAARSDKA